jgi:hypothetical protein
MDLDILISKAEQVMHVLEAFEPYDGDHWFAHVDAEDVDNAINAINEQRKAIAENKGE